MGRNIAKCFLVGYLAMLFVGCRGHYISIVREPMSQKELASTYVRSPDPLQKNPPEGQRLFVQYRLPQDMPCEDYYIVLQVLTKNLCFKKMRYDLLFQSGVEEFSLLGKAYKDSGGILGYKAVLFDREDHVIDERKTSLWVDQIYLKEQK